MDDIVKKNVELARKLNDRNGKILEAVDFMRKILPMHYVLGPRENGVHCYSLIGIDENDPEHWDYIYKAMQQKFGDDLMEVYHNTCTNHLDFNVFIRF
jgi:hypothetical protein